MWEPVTVRCIPRLGSSPELVWAMLPTLRPRPAPAKCRAASADAIPKLLRAQLSFDIAEVMLQKESFPPARGLCEQWAGFILG